MTRTIDTPTAVAQSYTQSDILGLVTRLTFTDFSGIGRGSNKFHDSLLIENHIVYRFGRVGTSGETGSQVFDTNEKAAAKYWGLLRSKIGKGYHVDTAKVISGSDLQMTGGFARIHSVNWDAIAPIRRYGIGHPEKLGLSPRTPKQGASVFLTLTSQSPDSTDLIACAMAGPTERFLLPMVLSHPACPPEAQVVGALLGMGASLSA